MLLRGTRIAMLVRPKVATPAPPVVIPNLLIASESLSSTVWKTVFSPALVESNVDGTADEVTYNASNYANRQHVVNLTDGQTYTVSARPSQAPTGSALATRVTVNNTLAWNTGGSTKHTLTAGYPRISHTWTQQGSTTAAIMFGALDETGDGDADCYGKVRFKEIMLNVGPTAAPYQFAAAPAEPLAKIFGCYWASWDTSFDITDVPEIFNVIWLFHCTPVPGGNGAFVWEYDYAVSNAQIQTVRARGQKVILTAGGQGMAFSFTTDAQVTNFVNSIIAIHTQVGGFDGVDMNTFEAGVASTPAKMAAIGTQLKAHFGQSFLITAPMALDSYQDLEMMLAMKNAGALDFAGGQGYAWSGFTPQNIKGWTDEIVLGMESPPLPALPGLGAEYTTVGLGANFDYASSLNLAETIQCWDLIKAAHPNIRGMYFWTGQTNLALTNAGEAEADGNNTFGTQLYARL